MPRRPKPTLADDPLWYKDAVIYQLHVKSFFDSNNDGVGDFAGLTAKLDHVVSLGATAVWLLPFYPSPRRDDGYDISDYLDVHPEYGRMRDLRQFIEVAHERGLRVITELVINHTSDQHPWFQRARRARRGTVARDYYVWSDDDKKYAGTRIIFSDTEKSNWTWDPVAEAYFWHRFYSHQPDLNFDNPRLTEAVLRVMRFWLGMGVDGLRLDAVPYLVEREGTSNENLPETHAILKRIRAEMDAAYPGRMLLAEANQWPEDAQQYFGDGDECHMAFHFPLMPRMYMAIAQEDRFPITDIMRQTPDIPPNCQWAVFLRNHDELTLEMVTDRERDYLWQVYAAERRARINLGIRRRLAPLLERDRRRIELMNSLLFTLPGTPVIYYGDEIGMGDNIHLGDRDGVRTPMQWSPDRNGGFSRADPHRLVLPPIMDPLYGYQTVNVEAQERDPHSLLNWMRRMLVVRREHKAFGRGSLRFLRPGNRKVLAYLREYEDETILCIATVSRTAQAVELDLAEYAGYVPVELTGRSIFPTIGKLTYLLTLQPYGFYCFLLCRDVEPPAWSVATPGLPDYHTFVLRESLDEILAKERAVLEKDVLPGYLATMRWFQGKLDAIDQVSLSMTMRFPPDDKDQLLTEIVVRGAAGGESRYLLPLAPAWEDGPNWPVSTPHALARVRRGRRVGLLTDAMTTPGFVHALMAALRRGDRLAAAGGEIVFAPTERLQDVEIAPDAEVDWPGGEQSNSSVLVGRKAIIKLIRRLVEGVHPEAEMGRELTLRGFQNSAPMLGEVMRRTADGQSYTLAIVHGFVQNQGDGWRWTIDYVGRTLDELQVTGGGEEGDRRSFAAYRVFAGMLGRRLGEMHSILAQPSEDPDFAPKLAGKADVQAWRKEVAAQLTAAFDALRRTELQQPEDRELAERVLSRSKELQAAVAALAAAGLGTLRTRIHGDLHLGQVLVTAGDVLIIDFVGEPTRPLS